MSHPAPIAVSLQVGHLYRTLQVLLNCLKSESDQPPAVSVSQVRSGYTNLPIHLLETPVPWAEVSVQSGKMPRSLDAQGMLTEDEAFFGLPTTLKRYGAHLFRSPGRFDLYLPVLDLSTPSS